MTSYSKRESVLHDGETVYSAGPDALEARRPDGARIAIPWAEVERARLVFAPTRMKPHRRLLTIAAPRSIVNIDNMHFAGIGRFERREAAFAAFAQAAAERIAAAAPQAGLFLGAAKLSYLVLLALGIGGFALAAIGILSMGMAIGSWPLILFMKVCLIWFFVPSFVRWAWRARPRRVDPDAFSSEIRAAPSPQS